MNSPTSPSQNIPDLQLEQVDPPHPIRVYFPAIAVGAVITIIAMLVWYTRMGIIHPVASGSIVRLMTYPVHTVSDPDLPGPGMPGVPTDQDQMLVLSQVQIKNTSKQPLQIFDLSADLTLPNDKQRSLGATTEDINRLFQRFSDLGPLRMDPLARQQVIPPGQTADGLVVFSYPITEDQWKLRKDLQITVSFNAGRSVILDAH